MSNPSVPNVLRGGATMTAQALNENFSALAASLSDGTKNLSVSTATVASDVAAAYVRVDGDANVTGEANGERSFIRLFSGIRTTMPAGTYYVSHEAEAYSSTYWETANYLMPRSGSVVGYAHTFGAYGSGTRSPASVTVVKITDVGGTHASATSTQLFSIGTFNWGNSGGVSGAVGTFTRNSYPVSAGALICARRNQEVSSVNLAFESLHLEIQWD